jgi:YD repeat-containing protein
MRMLGGPGVSPRLRGFAFGIALFCALTGPMTASAGTQSVTYDALGRVASVITTDGKQTIYSYDKAGNRTTVSVTTTATTPPTAPDQTMNWAIGGPPPAALSPSLGTGVTIVGVTPAQLGTSGFTSTTLTYTPPTGIIGGAPPADHFGYEVKNSGSGGLTASGVVTVTWTVGAPTAAPQSVTTPQSTQVQFNPINGQPNTTVTAITQPANGVAAIIDSGSEISYTPNGGYINWPATPPKSPDTFNYTLTNTENLSASNTVSVIVTATAPIAGPVSMGTAENRVATFGPLPYDSDPQYLPLSLISVGAAAHGTAATSPGNLISYTPASNYTGTDSFSYTIQNSGGGTASGTVSMQVGASLAVNLSATSWMWLKSGQNPPIQSNPIAATVSGGQAPYAFVWQFVSGQNVTSPLTPYAYSTYWNGSPHMNNFQYVSQWDVKVTDSNNNSVTSAQVTVTVEWDNGQ